MPKRAAGAVLDQANQMSFPRGTFLSGQVTAVFPFGDTYEGPPVPIRSLDGLAPLIATACLVAEKFESSIEGFGFQTVTDNYDFVCSAEGISWAEGHNDLPYTVRATDSRLEEGFSAAMAARRPHAVSSSGARREL